MSGSTTLTPALMFSSVVERISRLKRSSCPASSSTATTSLRSMPEPRSRLVSSRRAEAAPMEAASRRSVNCTHARLAAAAGCSSRCSACACSPNARCARCSPTTRVASTSKSRTLTCAGQSPDTAGRCAYGSRNGAARRRSAAPGRQRIDTSSIVALLSSSDQNVPWVSGSQPRRPNNCCGRSQSMPNGPRSSSAASIQPPWHSAGSSSV